MTEKIAREDLKVEVVGLTVTIFVRIDEEWVEVIVYKASDDEDLRRFVEKT